MSEWQDISTAPKDNSGMLLACIDWPHSTLRGKPVPIKVGGWDMEGKRWHIFGASWSPTHWMPLPAPPSPSRRTEEQQSN